LLLVVCHEDCFGQTTIPDLKRKETDEYRESFGSKASARAAAELGI
jgi:hypothetical protein